jgi:uroporphyrin-3 C-methyltransferase
MAIPHWRSRVSDTEPNTAAPPGNTTPSIAASADTRPGTNASDNNSASQAAPGSLFPGIAWLALFLLFALLIALALGTAWMLREGQSREAILAQRLAAVENAVRQKQDSLGELKVRLEQELSAGIGGLETKLGEQTTHLAQSLQSMELELAGQQKELARFSASDRESWLLAETGHLLRLANQRLVMAGDPIAAQALLDSADSVLRELDDPGLHAVRAAVAVDIAELRAVPKVDVEGIYLRLAALIEQADGLVIFQFPQQPAPASEEAAQDWRDRLQQGYKAALSQLSDYIIIRRRDMPMQALMDPQLEGLVRLNLRMLLEQAQIALLSGNQALYGASLERALQWVSQFQDADTATAEAIAAQIRHLATLTIQIPQPNISRSQQALDEAIAQREQARGEQ